MLKTSLVITGDSSVAKKAVDDLAAAVRGAGAAGQQAAAGLGAAEKAQDAGAAAAREHAAAEAALAAELNQARAAAAAMEGELARTRAAAASAEQATGALQVANRTLEKDLNQARAAAAGSAAELAAVQRAATTTGAAVDGMAAEMAAARGEIAQLHTGNAQLSRDLQQAQGAAAAMRGELAQVRQAGAATAAELAHVRGELTTATAAVGQLQTANAALAGELRDVQVAAAAMAGELKDAQQSIAGMAGRIDVLETRLKGSGKAMQYGAADANRHAFAVRNLGQQFGDMAVMIQGGISPARAFSTQAAQMGYAMSDMGGKAGAVGRFLVGPWGIALTVATAALAPLVEKMFEGSKAADQQAERLEQAASAADSYGNAQSMLGKVIDLTTGKLKTQNSVLIETVKLQARVNLERARAAIERANPETRKSFGERVSGAMSGLVDNVILANDGEALERRARQRVAAERGVEMATRRVAEVAGNSALADRDPAAYKRALDSTLASALAGVEGLAVKGKVAGKSLHDVKLALLEIGKNGYDAAAAADSLTALAGGGLSEPLRQDRKTRTKKPKSTEARDEFGRDTADRLAGIVGEFGDAPDIIEKANAKVRQLDDLIEDLGRKKPPNFAALVESAEAAKTVVREGLIRAIGEGFEKPKTLADKAAVAFGSLDAVVADLEKRRPPDFERLIGTAREARGVIEASLNKPLDDFLQQQRDQLAMGELVLSGRLAEAEALRAIVSIERTRGPLTAEQRAQVLATTTALQAQERQLERNRAKQQVSLNALSDMQGLIQQTIYEGPQSLLKVPERLFESFKAFSAERIAEEMFHDIFAEMRDQVTGANKVDVASNTLVQAFATTATAATKLSGALSGAAAEAGAPAVPGAVAGAVPPAGQESDDVVVHGRRHSDIYGEMIGKVLGKVGIGKDTAGVIGKNAGKALAGAFEGQTAAGVAGLLGIKTSQTGAGIGGALGGLTGLPGGSIVGGLLGGVVGGLFKKTEKASATIGAVDGAAAVTRNSGNSDGMRQAAGGLGDSVAGTIDRIVQQLGGELGSFAVSIGQRDKKFVVDPSGAGRTKGRGVQTFGTAEEAQGAALANALADGAIAGVSDAVQRAIRSSPNLDKAMAEAMKVQDVEALMGGQLATFQKAFREFEAQAKERVRIASQYGFDVLAIERKNADDRKALATQLASAQAGPIQGLIDELQQGSLFEGSAMDRIDVLTGAIAKASADIDANIAGAGDRFASLQEQRLSVSKDAYGATEAFASLRARTLSESQAAVARVNAQVAAANQAKSDPALTTTNATLDEIADQNARVAATLADANALLARIAANTGGGGGSGGFNVAQIAAY